MKDTSLIPFFLTIFLLVPKVESFSRMSPPEPGQRKAIIFDIDGTLADSWKLGYDATAVVLKKNGIPAITEEIYHQCTRYATPERLARHAGLLPSDPQFEERGKTLGEQFDNLYISLVTTETAGFFPGVKRLLDDIPPDTKLGALTNAAVRYAEAVLQVNDESGMLYKRFGSVRGADNVPKPKPFPDGLFTVCEDMLIAPVDCVYVGDSPSDAGAAKAAGMEAIGVTWGSHSKESLQQAPFDQICHSVDELYELLII